MHQTKTQVSRQLANALAGSKEKVPATSAGKPYARLKPLALARAPNPDGAAAATNEIETITAEMAEKSCTQH